MAEIVVEENEIYLSTTRFPIRGGVRPYLVSTWPGKVTIGDYTKDDEQLASNWIIGDQRGGILKEEMDESVDADRCWWTNCEIGFRGHMPLPPLATQITLPTVTTATLANGDMELDSDWTGGSRTNTEKHGGTYSWSVNAGSDAYQDISWTTQYQGRVFEITGWIKTAGSSVTIRIDDGVGTTDSTAGGASWTEVTVRRKLNASATRLRITLHNGGASTGFFDDLTISEQPTSGSPTCFINYNSHWYLAEGNILAKLNESTGATFDYLYSFPATITDLISSEDNSLYIFLGDSGEYFYMNTSESFTETDVADAQYGIHWDAKLFKINTSGQLSYSTDPSATSPSWTNNGLLPLESGACRGLMLYRDADQNEIIYASTKYGLWAHDYANAKWLQTLVQFAGHTHAGKGFVNWHDAAYIANGLEIQKYVTGAISTITSVGLNRDDSLPTEYLGEIVGLFGGHYYMYALVDSSLYSGTGYSGLYRFDGMNWKCEWLGSTADDTMHCGGVTSVYSYALYFDHDDKVYRIPLSRTNANPLKASGSTYASSGVWLSPWFDGGTSVYDKLAKRARIFCKDTTANETVAVKYRIDHANTDIDTGWTTLGTVVAAGDGVETEYTFGTGAAGIVFKAIQFRLDLARGGTNTLTPDVQWLGLSYIKLLDTLWGWSCEIDCSHEYKGNTSAQLDAALKTIVDTQTLVDFTFRDEGGGSYSYKVRVARCSGIERTGEDWRNRYSIELVAP